MGYNKIIIYGNNLETYEYEKDIVVLRGRKRNVASDDGDKNLGVGGENSLPERTLGRRPDNARRVSMAFRKLVIANLGRPPLPLLVTLTYGDNFTDLAGAYKHFSSFIQSLRHKFGKEFRYIAVSEFQKRGAIHFHALFWGLPSEIFLQERKTRILAGLWKQGFVYLKETDGDDAIANYLSKYMAKAFLNPRLKNKKAFCASRNVLRPIEIKGASPIWPVLDDYGVIEDSPVLDETYDTSWLKKCHHRIFKIKNDNA